MGTKSVRPRSFSVSDNLMGFLPRHQHQHQQQHQLQYFSQESSSFDEIDIVSGEEQEQDSGSSGSGSAASTTLSLMRRHQHQHHQQQQKKKRFNAAGTSLSHLVPNKLLMRVSRRISSHSPAECCKCTSCQQTVTPYWRDGWAEDVMLCNACGLRFQKFAQRCHSCMYIPRKEDGVEDTCPQCQATWIE
jgi:hypothetical protein